MSNSLKIATDYLDLIIEHRRNLHKIPEIGFRLPKTIDYITHALLRLNIDYEHYDDINAVVAKIDSKKKGKCMAIRADIDALLIEEENDLDYKSEHKGQMHACGHDSHAAVALVLAQILNENRDKFNGSVKIFFQPAEESPGGAKPMIEKGVMENPKVDAVMGFHGGQIVSDIPFGKIGIKKGAVMAAVDEFKITVKGFGGHAARPHEAKDPVLASSEIILALQQIRSRNINPDTPFVLSVCKINAGKARNIIPQEATIEGTMRSFDESTRKLARKRLREIAENIAAGYGLTCHTELYELYPPVINDEFFSQKLYETARKILGDDVVFHEEKSMGADDMSYFLNEAKGCYFLLNNSKSDDDVSYPLHHPKFNIDEKTLVKPLALFLEMTLNFLN